MGFQLDESMDWTEHFVTYGFAVRRGLVSEDFCHDALAEVARLLGCAGTLTDYTMDHPGIVNRPYFQDPGRTGVTEQNEVFEGLYEQPELRAAVAALFGDPEAWDQVRNYYMFVKPFDEQASPHLATRSHIDFEGQPPPALYRGFIFQIALAKTEPFGGNMTILPGTHVAVQRAIVEHPGETFPSLYAHIEPEFPAYEFVAEPGDVMFVHHLVLHAGNVNHGAGKRPRVVLMAEGFQKDWLTEIKGAADESSPWRRSLGLNGAFEVTDEAVFQRGKRQAYMAELPAPVATVWEHYSDWPHPPAVTAQ